MVVTVGTTIVRFWMVKFFLTLIYIRLPRNIRYFTVTHLNQAHLFNKAHCINAVNCFFSQSSTNISFNNTFYRQILSDHVGTSIHSYFWTKTTFIDHVKQRRHFGLIETTFHIPTFEDKGRLHAYHNKIKIDRCRGNPFQACLSEIAIDRDRPRFCYNRLGLFILLDWSQLPSPV